MHKVMSSRGFLLFGTVLLGNILIAACDDGGGGGNGGGGSSNWLEVPLDDELQKMVAIAGQACGTMDADSGPDHLVCFDTQGKKTVDMTLPEHLAVYSAATLNESKIVLVGWMPVTETKGEVVSIADIAAGTATDPVQVQDSFDLLRKVAGLSDGTFVILDPKNQMLRHFGPDGTLISEANIDIQDIPPGDIEVGAGPITGISADQVAIVSGTVSAHVSIVSLDGTVSQSFEDETAAAPSSNIFMGADGNLHNIRHAFAGHGDLNHFYDDVFDLQGNLVTTEEIPFQHTEECNGMTMLPDGTLFIERTEIGEGTTITYSLIIVPADR